MIGLGTNVLVRYIMQDDPKQAKLATKLIENMNEELPRFISLVCVVELSWVLGSAFELSRRQIVEAFQNLMSVDAFKNEQPRSKLRGIEHPSLNSSRGKPRGIEPEEIERVSAVAGAVRAYAEGKADFADYLIERSSVHAGCDRTMTFDREAAKSGGMILIH